MIVARQSLLGQENELRILLRGVSWDMYRSLRDPEENNHLRMTYDCGELEIMSPSRKHEQVSYLTGRMIDQWTLSKDIDVVAGRNTTFGRKDLEKGLEPDNCYWVSHALDVLDRDEIDLKVDPPPDLALEVEVSRSAIPKLPIYAALGVPEVWRWKFDFYEVLRLDSKGQYQPRKSSIELRKFPLHVATELISSSQGKTDTVIVKEFLRAIKGRR